MGRVLYLQKNASDNFAGLLDGFKKRLRETDHAENSVKSYLQALRSFLDWFNRRAGKGPEAVTPLDVVDYRQALQNDGKAPATVNLHLKAVRAFFGWLVNEGVVRDNPAEGVKDVATGGPPAPKWLTRAEQAALMRAVREGGSLRDEAVVGLMLHAGLRVSEVCALHREDIRIGERSGWVVVRQGKGNKYREVPLNKTVRKTLALWLAENPEGPLFPNRKGGPIGARGVFSLVAGYAYEAKLKDVSPHTLRHTFCKNAIDMGVPIDQVAVMAGHSSLDVTKRYTAPSRADLEAAVEKIAWE
ncbi:MAG: tyrosine-type recombinase/integrase [Pelotomaculum sp.]|nr:tyrosine-type recombinase/integrase [Pelotomaculum sp.]